VTAPPSSTVTAVSTARPSALPGASADPAADAPLLVINAVEYAFQTLGTIPGGLTHVQLKNLGKEDHQSQLLRLNDGVTVEQARAAVQQNLGAIFRLGTLVGGPGTAAPGTTSEALLDLKGGQHLILCFVKAPDGLAHVQHGMYLPLVVPPQTQTAASLPSVERTVLMKEFSFETSGGFVAGKQRVRVVNEGAQAHEFGVVRLAPGKQVSDVPPAFGGPAHGPPPVTFAGGMDSLSPGESGIAILDLTPGDYAAICLVKDPVSGKPHIDLGMILGFSVH
jgi:hypothetical protein